MLAVRGESEAEAGPLPIERALVARAQAGDQEAFRRIFETQAPGMRRLARYLLRDGEAAGEATQEAFVRAHRLIASLAEPDGLRSWLLAIVRNVCLEQLRARRRWMRSEGLDAIDLSPDVDRDAPSPEQLLLGREADELLAAALGGLSEERRTALLLRIDHDLSYEEIASVMGWPLHKVKNEVRKARLGLRAALAAYLGEQP